METKKLRIVNSLVGFILGAFTFGDILDFIFLYSDVFEKSKSLIIAHGIYVAGLILIFVFFALILRNIKKGAVFTARNEKLFRYFGIAILVLGMVSDVLHKQTTDVETAAPRVLALLGGTLIFTSIIFKIGIKMQEEQELTI